MKDDGEILRALKKRYRSVSEKIRRREYNQACLKIEIAELRMEQTDVYRNMRLLEQKR